MGTVLCTALAGTAVGTIPGDGVVRVLRVVGMACLVATSLGFLLGLRRELDAALALAHQQAHTAREQAHRDALTGLLNRRGLQDRFPATAATARRTGLVLAITSFDLDHFKDVNDTWGHAGGDEALTAAAHTLLAGTHGGDLVVRLGGEELLVVHTAADVPSAVAAAERLRAAIARECTRWSLTASAGMVTWDTTIADGTGPVLEDLLRTADRRLYRAKAAGRDRLTTSG